MTIANVYLSSSTLLGYSYEWVNTLSIGYSYVASLPVVVDNRVLKKSESAEFVTFADQLIDQRREEGRTSCATKYRTALNSLRRFLNGRKLTFDKMDAALLLDYERFLLGLGLCRNTTSFYMRNLRAIYNRAVKQGLTEQQYPFAEVYTGIDKTVKRAIDAESVQRIQQLELPENSTIAFARDMFVSSLMLCGISLIDLAFLRKSDLQGEYILYHRQKTGQQIRIHWEPAMQAMVDKYDTGDSPYLFPIIRHPGLDEDRQYWNMLHQINKYLKRIGEMVGLTCLTTYVARHAWASIARKEEVPMASISEALGHTSERTTRIYLKSLDNSSIDRASKAVLDAIFA